MGNHAAGEAIYQLVTVMAETGMQANNSLERIKVAINASQLAALAVQP